jgi:flavin-dependent dehydrogenase
VGAFGLDDGSSAAMARALGYCAPEHLTTIVTKVHPGEEVMGRFGNRIHAILLSQRRVEFGAVTPKGNHLSINIAGENLDVQTMKAFLAAAPVRKVLDFESAELSNPDRLSFFKGRFPISTARRLYGDRYALVGDAAGLVRAFKGKGINSACQSGMWAAEAMFTRGISRAALDARYRPACSEILSDLPYGRAVRRLVALGRRSGLMDFALGVAESDADLQRALLDAVSGNRPYRTIVHSLCKTAILSRAARRLLHKTVSSVRPSDDRL